MAIIDLQTIRYINLLDGVSKVKTRKCFTYNNVIFFAVEKNLVSKAIGPNAMNVRRISEQLGKRIKVIAESESTNEAERFISDIIEPVQFKEINIEDKTIIINAGSQSKAALIGRNRRREAELKQIIMDNFGMELKII